MQALMMQGNFLEQAHLFGLTLQIRMQITQGINTRLIGATNLAQHGVGFHRMLLAGRVLEFQPAQAIHPVPGEHRPALAHSQAANQIQRPQFLPGLDDHDGIAGFQQHFQVVQVTHGFTLARLTQQASRWLASPLLFCFVSRSDA